MGVGDEIMASGHARAEHLRTGKRVQILDLYGNARWDEIWQYLPWIAQPRECGDFATIKNGPQCRPYIQYPFTAHIGQRWTSWRARDHVGAIEFSQAEQRAVDGKNLPERFIVIEPHVLRKSNPNKQWGEDNWHQLARLLIARGHKVVQMGRHPLRVQPGVKYVRTRSFREAAAVLSRAAAAILPEGGLHHAAGVLNVPAVVLFGGAISPQTTGYEGHVNLADFGEGSPCGNWQPCGHCREIWRSMKPESVSDHLESLMTSKEIAA